MTIEEIIEAAEQVRDKDDVIRLAQNVRDATRERFANVQVQCPKFGITSDDYLQGFQDGASAVTDIIRNSTT